MDVNDLAQYLENKGCKLKGCTMQEVNKIEGEFGIKLPASYVYFLLLMGKDAGEFLKGSSVFYNEMFVLRESSMELLNENNFKSLPPDTFVFWMHQGYQFAFFDLKEGDNPPIYFYYEGKTEGDFEKKENSFTDFLEKQLAMSGLN
jgi:hypothetical protein